MAQIDQNHISLTEDFNKRSLPDAPLPVFVKIAEHIARDITAGRLAVGSKLPPEREMAKTYDVAVGTLRKALGRLTEMELLERRQGSGNYICKTEQATSLYNFFRLEMPSGGGLPTAKLLDYARVRKPDDLPDFGTADFGHRFRRIRFLDGEPVALEEIWLDGDVIAEISADQITESLYHFFKTELNIWIARAEDWVAIAPPPPWYRGQIDTMMGYIERFGWSNDNKKIEYSRTWYDASKARYVARLT